MTNPYSLPGKKTIEQAVCEEWGVTPEQLRSASRKHRLPEARKLIMFYYRTYEKASWAQAGNAVNRDHCTAIDGCRKFVDFMNVDPVFREKANRALKDAMPQRVAFSVDAQKKGEMVYHMTRVDNNVIVTSTGPVWSFIMDLRQAEIFAAQLNQMIRKIKRNEQ
jgi:hypothetical protein